MYLILHRHFAGFKLKMKLSQTVKWIVWKRYLNSHRSHIVLMALRRRGPMPTPPAMQRTQRLRLSSLFVTAPSLHRHCTVTAFLIDDKINSKCREQSPLTLSRWCTSQCQLGTNYISVFASNVNAKDSRKFLLLGKLPIVT